MKAHKTGQGVWQIVVTENGKTKTIYIGKGVGKTEAVRIARILSEVRELMESTGEIPNYLRREFETIPKRIRDSAERHGIFRRRGVTFNDLCNEWHRRATHLKPGSIKSYRNWEKRFEKFIDTKIVSSFSKQDAISFVLSCRRTMCEYFLARVIRHISSVFRLGVELGYCTENPFASFKFTDKLDGKKQFYISREISGKILNNFSNENERLVFALARFAGLRVPSELLPLRWCDFAGGFIRVDSETKTGTRRVPILPEVKAELSGIDLKSRDLVFPGRSKNWFRSVVIRAILQSGERLWPKLFVNCRSSLITDLDEMNYSSRCLDAFFGNSEQVRQRHYIQFHAESEFSRLVSDHEILTKYLSLHGGQMPDNTYSLRDLLVLVKHTANMRNENQSEPKKMLK
ncbi:MAG: tyrosine-type recombinase/integrase [Thermoguttaceae bacterium]